MEPEHISRPIKRVLEVIYEGSDWEMAIQAELQRLGLSEDHFHVIVAVPEKMADNDERQLKMFE
jgi:hypothetical protein